MSNEDTNTCAAIAHGTKITLAMMKSGSSVRTKTVVPFIIEEQKPVIKLTSMHKKYVELY